MSITLSACVSVRDGRDYQLHLTGKDELAGLAVWELLGKMDPSWWHLGIMQKAAWLPRAAHHTAFSCAGLFHCYTRTCEKAVSRDRILALYFGGGVLGPCTSVLILLLALCRGAL